MTMIFTSLLASFAIWAGAVDECIDSASKGKVTCGPTAVMDLCPKGPNCGPLCEPGPSGKCFPKGTLANLLMNACRDGRNLSTETQDLCSADSIQKIIETALLEK